MITKWCDDLATGNDMIDNQHKELFKRINDLLIACVGKKGKDEVGNLLQYLKEYVKIHFSDEESLQLQEGYPLYKVHREQHDSFISKLIGVEDQFNAEGETQFALVNAGNMTLEWLTKHIYQSDKKMAEFVNKSKKR